MRPATSGRIVCLALLAGAVALSASGCSSAPASPAPSASAAPMASASAAATTPPTATPPVTAGATAPLPTASALATAVATPLASPSAGGSPTAPPGSAAPASPFLPIGGPVIGLLTPEQGVGQAPRFEWTAVTGAARYLLFVFDANGRMYWAWEGTATSVYLGGLAQPPKPGTMGPTLSGPMSWAVIAYDAGGKLIASSPRRPVAP